MARPQLVLGFVLAIALSAWSVPEALASNTIYWTGETASKVSFANLSGVGPAGDLNTTGATGTGFWDGTAIDPASGKVYWSNWNGSKISWAFLNGSGGGDLNTTGATVVEPLGIVVDHAAGKVYWANWGSGGVGSISWANLDGSGGGDLNLGGATVAQPWGVAIDQAAGKIYWANGHGANTISFALLDNSGHGGNISTTGATVSTPEGVAIDSAHGRIYWANFAANVISYTRLDGTGGGDIGTAGASISGPDGVAIDPAGGRVYWANNTSNSLSFANLDGSGGGGDLTTAGATPSDPSMPSLLEAPQGGGAPVISGATTTPAVLTCSQGTWAQDDVGALLYHAPQSFSYSWMLNGVPISGATSNSTTASSPGNYACSVTASNAAGSTMLTSSVHAVASPPPPPPPTASMTSAVHGASATLTFSCSGVAGQSCSGTYAVTAHKTTCGSTVKAVSAAHKKHKPKCVTKVTRVNLGGGSYVVSAGHSTRTSFTVARNGVALLFHFYRLPTTFSFAAFSSNAPGSRVVVFAYKRITSSLDNFQLAAGSSSTLVSSWPIKKIPRGATVKVTCHGGGCPFSQRVYRNKSHVSILQGAHLLVGTTVRVIVNAPFSVGEVLTATIKSLAAPKEVLSCLPPGAGAPLKCTA
jgi:DNA-binding beta-propeller fold protein YncE